MNRALRQCSQTPNWRLLQGFVQALPIEVVSCRTFRRNTSIGRSVLPPSSRNLHGAHFARVRRSRQPGRLCSIAASAAERLDDTAQAPVNSRSALGEKPSQKSLLQYIKAKAGTGAVRKIVSTVQETEAGSGQWGESGLKPDANAYRNAIRALLKAGRTDLAVELYRLRMKSRASRPDELPTDFPLASSVIRAVLRDCKKRKLRALDSQDIFDEVKKDCVFPVQNSVENSSAVSQNVARKAQALISIMNAFLTDGDVQRGTEALNVLKTLGATGPSAALPVTEYNTAIRHLGKSRSMTGVFYILDLMRASQVEPNNETFEFLANSAVRQVEFVTGAVSMETLPTPTSAEVAFVGRSNVGKSSLVNMLCNRKALAYVSGTPGKTQQFNYFLVNGRDREQQFYMVDLPGVGYAKVPKPVQEAWTNFMRQYFMYRTSLRLIFHLVDGRHGALADDEALMRQMSSTGKRQDEYVIVLTKMDKMSKQKAKRSILDKTREALVRNGCPRETPIVLTSASSKLGREEMWRHLQAVLTSFPAQEERA